MSADDGHLYIALRQAEDSYRELFEALGFSLVSHDKGFYYFNSDKPQDSVPRMVTFVFVIVDWLADQGGSLVEEFFSREFVVANLPHLEQERYARYMREHDVRTQDELVRIVKLIESYGFAAPTRSNAFKFRPPAYRILDLCIQLAQKAEAEPTPSDDAGEAA